MDQELVNQLVQNLHKLINCIEEIEDHLSIIETESIANRNRIVDIEEWRLQAEDKIEEIEFEL